MRKCISAQPVGLILVINPLTTLSDRRLKVIHCMAFSAFRHVRYTAPTFHTGTSCLPKCLHLVAWIFGYVIHLMMLIPKIQNIRKQKASENTKHPKTKSIRKCKTSENKSIRKQKASENIKYIMLVCCFMLVFCLPLATVNAGSAFVSLPRL